MATLRAEISVPAVLERALGSFMKAYARKKRKGGLDPNDRPYDRELETELKRLPPEELDESLRGEDGEPDRA